MTLVLDAFSPLGKNRCNRCELEVDNNIARLKCEFYMKKLYGLNCFQNKQIYVFHPRAMFCSSLVNTLPRE